MRVWLDGTPLTAPNTGIARYTIELTSALRELHPEAEISFAARPANAGILEGRWWSIGLSRRMRRENIDLFHGTDFAVPLFGRTPSVVTVHDLSPLRAREWHMPATALQVARRLPGAIERARVVITPSERVKEEIIERFGASPAKIRVTPLAASDAFQPKPVLPGAPYLLYVGSGQERKNLGRLLTVYERVRKDTGIGLVLVGSHQDFTVQLGVRRVMDVSDDALASLYSNASAFVYPSLYEGFGLPVVEAMACGAPVAVSRGTASADVAGDAAMLFDPASVEEMESALRTVLGRPEVAAGLRKKSIERAKCFSWKTTAMRTWEAYESALSRS